MNEPFVTVIMRTKNSDWVVAQALEGLFSQSYKNFELLVVDSSSTDTTLEILKQYPCRLISIKATEYYPGIILNRSIEATTSDLIVFQNSDCVPLTPDSLKNLLAPFEKAEIIATFARQCPRPEAHTWVKRDYYKAFPASGEAPSWLHFSLPFAAIRRKYWEIHPFYTEAWGSEDMEWGYWMKQQGYKICYVPESLVMHSHNYTLRQMYGRRFIEGEADALIFKRKENLFKMKYRFLISLLRDGIYHLKEKDIPGFLFLPLRRFVYQWAYYRGHCWGQKRIRTQNRDASVGQKTVLERYE